MGTVAHFDCVCRLCGNESVDLIDLYDHTNNERNLVGLLKKYVRITVNSRDGLPRNICGPCVAKLDEVVDFIDVCLASQTKLQNMLKESTEESEDRIFDLIQGVKVELEEGDDHLPPEDLNDEDYEPHPSKRKKRRGRKCKDTLVKLVRNKKAGVDVYKLDTSKSDGESKKDSTNVPKFRKVDLNKDNEGIYYKESEGRVCKEEVQDAEDEEKGEGETSTESSPKVSKSNTAARCTVCKSPFSALKLLEAHYLEAHNQADPRYMCPQCPRVFSKVTSLHIHQRRKHQESLQGCPKCKKLFPVHYLWTRHMLVHTNTRPFSCDECQKNFKSKAELTKHKRTHRPNEERYTHCCEVCGKRFTQKGNLDSHLRIHTGNRPFACEFCGKCFSQRGNMEEHRRMHTGEKPYMCQICGSSYARQGQLSMHRRRHSGIKPHKCPFCAKDFISKEVLKKHERIHTDERPFKCSFCDKFFRDRGKRRIHERLHTGERPFECQYCGRGFCESGNLRKHMRVHQRCPVPVLPRVAPVREKEPEMGSTEKEPSTDMNEMSNYSNNSSTSSSSKPVPQVHNSQPMPALLPVRPGAETSAGSSQMVHHSLPHSEPQAAHQPLARTMPAPMHHLAASAASGAVNHTMAAFRPLSHMDASRAGLPLHGGHERPEYRMSNNPYQVPWPLYHT